MNLLVNNPLLLLLVVTAAGAILVKDLIGAVFILGCYSFVLALIWAELGAVDVAFTEAVVGAGLSTVFFLAALFLTTSKESPPLRRQHHWLGAAGLIVLGLLLLYGAQDLPRVGDPASPASVHVSPAYLEGSLPQTLTPNVVTSIIMDYRALDTLIETMVIFTGGIACALLLRRHP